MVTGLVRVTWPSPLYPFMLRGKINRKEKKEKEGVFTICIFFSIEFYILIRLQQPEGTLYPAKKLNSENAKLYAEL